METDQSKTPPPLKDWQRMSKYLHSMIPHRADLEPLRQSGWRISIHAHERAVFIPLVQTVGSSGHEAYARIEKEDWWKPATRAHGDELADELARQALQIWQERQ